MMTKDEKYQQRLQNAKRVGAERVYECQPRGISGHAGGNDCFFCGDAAGAEVKHYDCACFVSSRETGEAIVGIMGGRGVWLDWRPTEPDWIQVKMYACENHIKQFEILVERVAARGGISLALLQDFDGYVPPGPETLKSHADALAALMGGIRHNVDRTLIEAESLLRQHLGKILAIHGAPRPLPLPPDKWPSRDSAPGTFMHGVNVWHYDAARFIELYQAYPTLWTRDHMLKYLNIDLRVEDPRVLTVRVDNRNQGEEPATGGCFRLFVDSSQDGGKKTEIHPDRVMDAIRECIKRGY